MNRQFIAPHRLAQTTRDPEMLATINDSEDTPADDWRVYVIIAVGCVMPFVAAFVSSWGAR